MFAPRMSNSNTQSCSNFCNSYLTVSKNHCLSTQWCSLVNVDRLPYLSASTMVCMLLNILIHSHILHCGKEFHPYFSVNCWWNLCPFHSFRHTKKCTTACCLYMVDTSNTAVIFTSCSIGTNGQLNHIHSMSPSDLYLQHDEVSAVLPIIQQKYSNTDLTPLISFVCAWISTELKDCVHKQHCLNTPTFCNILFTFCGMPTVLLLHGSSTFK
jgi:hypothetical protein